MLITSTGIISKRTLDTVTSNNFVTVTEKQNKEHCLAMQFNRKKNRYIISYEKLDLEPVFFTKLKSKQASLIYNTLIKSHF